MSHRGRRNFKGSNREKRPLEDSESSLKFPDFECYRKELDDRHDRHERLVKLSRDITIESKRIIFLLHTIDSKKNNQTVVLEEAKNRIDKLIAFNFAAVAKELKGQEVYQYIRAVSPGFQEFVEALSFYKYLSDVETCDYNSVQSKFLYKSEDGSSDTKLVLPFSEFILGFADLTGEVMRYCINSLGSGQTENCFKTCQFLQFIYGKYLSIKYSPRDFSQKMQTMRASTLKCEQCCYQLRVRGNEGAKFPTFAPDIPVDDNIDEGFF